MIAYYIPSFSRMISTICLQAWVLLIFSSLLNDYDIVTASTIAAVLDFPTGLIASFSVHQLGRRPTILLGQFSSGISALICALLTGKYLCSEIVLAIHPAPLLLLVAPYFALYFDKWRSCITTCSVQGIRNEGDLWDKNNPTRSYKGLDVDRWQRLL